MGKSIKLLMTAVTLCTALVVPATAAPFGYEKEQWINPDNVKFSHSGKFVYLKSVPKPHPDLSQYVAVTTPAGLVCGIWGRTPTIPRTEFYAKASAIFDRISMQLDKRYGEHANPATRTTNLIATRLWMNGGYSDHIHAIHLQLQAVDGGGYQVELSYYFDNVDECRQETAEDIAADEAL
jgi:hypothetical protein